MKVIHLDVDGVLADFTQAACITHGKERPPADVWDLAEYWGMTKQQFWKPLDAQWFLELPMTPEADLIVKIVEQHEFLFVTSPPNDDHVKAKWLRNRWPKHKRRICICAQKHLIGGGLLIDDYKVNYKGTAIHWPVGLDELKRRIDAWSQS